MKKVDEMEMSINLKASRISMVFGSSFLFGWIVIEMIRNERIAFLPFILLMLQNVVFFLSKAVITKRLTRVDGDEE